GKLPNAADELVPRSLGRSRPCARRTHAACRARNGPHRSWSTRRPRGCRWRTQSADPRQLVRIRRKERRKRETGFGHGAIVAGEKVVKAWQSTTCHPEGALATKGSRPGLRGFFALLRMTKPPSITL